MAVLDPKIVKDMLLSGYTVRDIAEEYGVSPSTVVNTAHRSGMVYENKLWRDTVTGRTETEGILDRLKTIADRIRDVLFGEPEPPQIPQIPEPPRFDFGLSGGLGSLFPQEDIYGRIHMEIVVQIDFKPDLGYEPYIEEMKILQYDDPDIIRRTILAKMKEVDREDIEFMHVWIDGEHYRSFDHSDFEFDTDEDKKRDTP